MAFTYTVVAESDLLVGWGWGRITADEIVEAARLLPSLPGYRAGIDRITVIHPDALLSEMSPAALRDLRAHLRGYDHVPDGTEPPSPLPLYRSALVSEGLMAGILLKLYGEYGNTEPDRIGEFRMFANPADALVWLGRDGVALPPAPYEEPDGVAPPRAVGQDRS